MENNFTIKIDKWPKTVIEAYNLLIHWKQDPRNLLRVLGSSSDGVAFANIDDDETKPGKGKKDKSHITCHKCGNKGHYANECPELDGVNMLLAGVEEGAFDNDVSASSFTFHTAGTIRKGTSLHQRNGKLPASWILLDNQSTVNIFSNRKLLKNVRATDRVMSIRCNAGVTRTHMIGNLHGYDGEVWYNPNGIANILSLSDVEKYKQVTYDKPKW
jgi:hypothetical protein